MACNIAKFRDSKTKEAVKLVYNEASPSYRISGNNSIVITPKSYGKIKTQNQAFRAAEAMEKKIAKEFGKDFRFDVYGKWTTIHKNPSGVRLEVNIPTNLLKAYQVKNVQEKSDYFGTDTAQMEQQQFDFPGFFDAPVTVESQLNSSEFVSYKETLIRKAENKIKDLKASLKQKYTAKERKKIGELERFKEKMQEDVREMKSVTDVMPALRHQIEKDLDMIDQLLATGEIADINTAEEIISFYINMTDYKIGSKNKFLNFSEIYDKKGNLILDDGVKRMLNNTATAINDKYNNLGVAKREYLQELVDNSDQIQKLLKKRGEKKFDIEELLKDIEDIGILDENFLTIDKQFAKKDSLLSQLMKIELERERSNEKSRAATLIKDMNLALKDALPFLPNIGAEISWFNGALLTKSYSMFMQKNALGNDTSVLVSKLSAKWESAKRRHFAITSNKRRRAGTQNEVNAINKDDYDWIDANANFLDLSLVPKIINDPQFIKYVPNVDHQAAAAYEAKLIGELGKDFYDRMVDEQIMYLLNFEDVGPRQKNKNNPFLLLQSKATGGHGKVLIGGQEVQINPRFNSYYPKRQTLGMQGNTFVDVDSGYYDKQFEQIENQPELYRLWKTFENGAEYINDTLADANSNLVHGSILSMRKSFSEILMNRSSRGRRVELSEWLGNSLKTLYTHTKNKKNASEGTSINKSQFKVDDTEVDKIVKKFQLKLKRLHNINSNEVYDLLTAPQEVLDFFAKELGTTPTRNNLTQTLGVTEITPSALADLYISDQVRERNSANLPVLMRAYMEMTAEYKAQKESQPRIEIFKQFYDRIKKERVGGKQSSAEAAMESERTKNIVGTERTRAKKRLDYWYNKNVKGTVDSPASWVIVGTTYERHEKELKKELEIKIKDPSLSQEQKDKIQLEIDMLGMNITISAAFNAVINKFSLFKGLAYSAKSATINRFQGWLQGAINDGKYWKEGNFDIANRFITRKTLRYLPTHKSYKKEIDKVKLMVNILNILQDATNELDRARVKTSGEATTAQKLNPFYLTEYVEWHNQTPQILSMLMDMDITDKNGNTVKVFDGKSLPAHDIVNGYLVLKPDFAAVPGNTETWQNFSNKDASTNKLYMSEVIGIVNGDYSKTGTTKIKKNVFGRSLMLFKNWLSNYIWNRIATGQTNLILGEEDVKGFYTSHREGTLAATLGTVGTLALGPLGTVIGIGAGIAIGNQIRKRHAPNAELREDIGILEENAKILGELLLKMGSPINAVTGNRLWKKRGRLEGLTVSEQDRQNLNSVLTETSVLISLALFKVMMKSMLGNDDEEEPKTLTGGEDNPYYFLNPGQSDTVKAVHNVIENESTRILGDIVGIQSPTFYMNAYNTFQVAKTIEDIYKLTAAYRTMFSHEDKLQSGINAGESKSWNATKKLFLPGIVKDVVSGEPWKFGYGESMKQEYDNTEYFDSYFYSDYKKDRKEAKAERNEEKLRLRKEQEELFKYNEKTEAEKRVLDLVIDPIVNQVSAALAPYPYRILYTKDQEKIEIKPKKKEPTK